MTLMYAAPFVFLSIISFLLFLAVARFRRYAFYAFVVPVAFGFSSIVGMLMIVASAGALNKPLPPLTGIQGLFISIAVYFVPGLFGTWLAVLVVKWLLGKRA